MQDGVQWLRLEPEGLPANDNRVDVHYGSGEISGAHEGGMPHFFANSLNNNPITSGVVPVRSQSGEVTTTLPIILQPMGSDEQY